MKIILISGKAQHGKDTFAELLKYNLQHREKQIIIDRFAKYIKGYCMQLGWDGKEKTKEIRERLQKLGTEIIQQNLNKREMQAHRMAEDIDILSMFGIDYFIIPDTRFPMEIYMMKSMFPKEVITVRVERDNITGGLTEDQLQHKSETSLDNFKFDWVVKNNGTLEDLNREVDIFIKHNL